MAYGVLAYSAIDLSQAIAMGVAVFVCLGVMAWLIRQHPEHVKEIIVLP